MVPTIRRETVDVNHWLSDEEMVDCFAIVQSLPGMLAINSCIYIGYRVKKLPGALVSAFAMTFPAFLAIIVILLFLGKVEDNPYVLGAFEGIKAASVALILVTVYNMGKKVLGGAFSYLVALAAFVLIVVLGINAVWSILLGGAAGYVYYVVKGLRKAAASDDGNSETAGPEKEGREQ